METSLINVRIPRKKILLFISGPVWSHKAPVEEAGVCDEVSHLHPFL